MTLEAWRAVTQRPGLVEFFRGTFQRAGVTIAGSGESFTCVHRGDRIVLEPGVDAAHVDFTVALEPAQAEHFAREATSGELSALERFRILSTLFTPATAATLRNPIMSNGLLRRLARVEDLIHVRLVSPAGEEPDATHTLVHAAGQWLVLAGLHGRPRRVFTLDVDEARRYQRRVIEAMHSRTYLGWVRFATWYLAWRRTVSKPA